MQRDLLSFYTAIEKAPKMGYKTSNKVYYTWKAGESILSWDFIVQLSGNTLI